MQPGPSPLLGLVAVFSAALGRWGAPPSSGRKLDLVVDSLEALGGHCREQREACETASQAAARSVEERPAVPGDKKGAKGGGKNTPAQPPKKQQP